MGDNEPRQRSCFNRAMLEVLRYVQYTIGDTLLRYRVLAKYMLR